MELKAGTILINTKTKEIGLVYRTKWNDYSYPKGHLEKGETLQECAIRETVEETGRDCHLIDDKEICILKYNTSSNNEVENYMYLAEDDGEHIGESPDPENLVWVKPEEVYDKLSYQDLKDLWQDIYPKIKEILDK